MSESDRVSFSFFREKKIQNLGKPKYTLQFLVYLKISLFFPQILQNEPLTNTQLLSLTKLQIFQDFILSFLKGPLTSASKVERVGIFLKNSQEKWVYFVQFWPELAGVVKKTTHQSNILIVSTTNPGFSVTCGFYSKNIYFTCEYGSLPDYKIGFRKNTSAVRGLELFLGKKFSCIFFFPRLVKKNTIFFRFE